MGQALTRRGVLKSVAALGCSAAAHPLMTSVTLASAPWDARLVVLILRGGMDGLDVVRPVGDRDFAALRPSLDGTSLPLAERFAGHPALAPLMPLWAAGELGFVHAVSTPYRDRRSHFDGQDLLEAGTAMDAAGIRDGWLNRMLQTVPGLTGETAYAIGQDNLRLLSGAAEVANWSPETRLDLTAQSELLLRHIYAEDAVFAAAVEEALRLTGEIAADAGDAGERETETMGAVQRRVQSEVALAAFAADRLNHDTRIAAFSINGWDTHRNQAGPMAARLGRLSDVLLTLRDGLGANWERTAVLAMTEFGRTARENGSRGTDHGTGGAMILAGGAIRGGQVFGAWPGLAEVDLYDRRDLMPTGDVRGYAAWVMRGLFGLDRTRLERAVFPGLDMGADPGLLL